MIHITDTSYQFQNSLNVKFKSSHFTHVAFLRSEALKDDYGASMKACAKNRDGWRYQNPVVYMLMWSSDSVERESLDFPKCQEVGWFYRFKTCILSSSQL